MAFFQGKHVWVDESGDGIATLVLDSSEKVIHLNPTVLGELEQALSRIEAEPRFRLCMLTSKKGASFCHGVAASTFQELQTPEACISFTALGQRVCDRLTQSRLPTVALIAGGCFGGGLELALACDWRITVAKPATQLGFTELEWGIMPSWGGVGRLLHLVGLERGLQFLLGAKKWSAQEARRFGLVDDVVTSVTAEPPAFIAQAVKRSVNDRPRRTWRQRLFESTGWGRRMILRGAKRVLGRRVPDDMPAPWELLETVRIEVEQGPAAAKVHAGAAMSRLGQSNACRNLLRLQIAHDAHRFANSGGARAKNIGILGATPLALHLAAQAAVKGCHVVLREKDELTLGMATLRLVQTLQEDLKRSAITHEQFTSNINRVKPTISWKGFAELELIIDATHGGIEAEQRMARELEPQVSAEAVIATVQPWRALAGWQPTLRCPQRALALHFPAPLGRTPLVEIMAPAKSDEAAKQTAQAFVSMMGKTGLIVQEASGGLVQRVWIAGISEALHLLSEGFLPERVEQAMQCFGMVYGPLEYLDWWGVDEFVLCARRLEPVLLEALTDHPIVKRLLEKNWLGHKSGIGVYRHAKSSKALNSSLRRWLLQSFAGRLTPTSIAEQKNQIQQRLVGRMVNEAFRCLGEGVVAGADEADLAMTLVGWAPHRGGPCRYAEQTGFIVIVEQLNELAKSHGQRFTPCPALIKASVEA